MFPVTDFPVADDFAAISERLKEIEWEAAMSSCVSVSSTMSAGRHHTRCMTI
jgi:hypothetical protein